MAEYQSGGISFGGLGSGTDFSTIITQMKKIEQIQMNRLLKWRNDWKLRVEGFDEINAEVQKLKTLSSSMDTPAEFVTKTATSSTQTVATATTTASVTEGLYKLEVNQVARNAMVTYNSLFDAEDTKINETGSGQTFTYQYKGESRTVNIADGTTLKGLVNMINGDPQNPGVKASMVKNGEKFMLQIRGLDLGATNDLNITGSTLTSIDANAANWAKQTAQNAQYRINGFPASPGWLESTTNAVNQAVDGMTITLKDTGTTQISVSSDTGAIKDKIKEFVEAVNTVRAKILELTAVNADATAKDPSKLDSQFDAEIGSKLTGNYGVQMVGTRMKSLTANRALGFVPYDKDTGTGDKITALSQIGIATVADQGDKDNGLLRLDETILDEALQKNPQGVIDLFASDFSGRTDNGNFSFVSALKPGSEGYVTHPGEHKVSYTVRADGTIDPDSVMVGGEKASLDSGNQIVATKGNSLGLSILVNNLAPGDYSGKVYVKEGKAGEIATDLAQMLSSKGTLNIISKNYKDIMLNADKKILSEQERLVRWERTMRLKFSRLDGTLSQYNGKMQQLQSQLVGLQKQ